MKKVISILLSVVFIFTIFSGCSQNNSSEVEISDVASSSAISQVIEVVSPQDPIVSFHTEKQDDYLSGDFSSLPSGINGKKEKSRPEPVQLQWEYDGEQASQEYVVNISENQDMSSSVTYTSSTDSLDVYNLKIGTTYYWTVSYGKITSDVFSFTTDGTAPRNLYVDGITNVRDLGGWVTESGTRTKQGMIFRCGRLNESSADTATIEITDDGIKTMRDVLGVKSEIDLRRVDTGEIGGITSSPLGEDVNYFSCPMTWEGDTFVDNKDEILEVFSILADEDNYPIIFHCNIGTDRTGMIAFLVNALLGVSEEDLCRDYIFSSFGNIGGKRTIDNLMKTGYYTAVMEADGESLSEKAYNCLSDFGVPEEELDSIIAILS
jgi:hypothetical protein